MTVSVLHQKVSAIADDPASVAAGEVVPSDWNASHNITMDSGFLLGRSTAGAGSAEEITVGSGLSLSGGTLSASGTTGVSSFSAGTTGFTPNTATTGDVTLAGTLAVANGGTGVTTSTGTGSVVLSNSPTLVTPALGTPSSGVVTNLTGTASININGTVGATTPTTGAFTTINASSTSTLTGNVGIGNPPTNDALRVSGTASGSTFINGVLLDEMVGSGVTSAYRSVLSRPILQDATFTLTNLYHFYANPQTKPAAATLTNQYGFHAESTLTDATNNFGFYSNIASAANRWNFYANGTASNHLTGTLSIGTPAVTYNLEINKSLTGGVERYQALLSGEIQSDVTTLAIGILNSPTINNSAFTLSTYRGFQASAANISGAATITAYHGFFHGAVTAANITNTYGYTSNIAASGTARWNFYAGGTAPNYMAGPLGIGATTTVDPLRIGGTLTGSAYITSIAINPTVGSAVTGEWLGVLSRPTTQAATFTLDTLIHFMASPGTKGAGSTITNQYGFLANSMTGATNNYGVFVDFAASGTSRWSIYVNGTAPSYFASVVRIGATTGDQALNVNGAVRVSAITSANQTSAGTMDFTGGSMRFLCWGASGTQGNFLWFTGTGGSGATQRMALTGANNLGLATSTFGTSATNTFSLANGTAPSSGVADTVQYYSSDLSAGNTIPSWYTEGTNVGTGTPTADRTIAVRYNGTVYYLLASTIP